MLKNLIYLQKYTISKVNIVKNMSNCAKIDSPRSVSGKLRIDAKELNLDLTLLGGQSFRWQKVENEQSEWHGVAFNTYWVLQQSENEVTFKAYPAAATDKEHNLKAKHFEQLLRTYFRLDFDLSANLVEWKKAHKHFENLTNNLKAVRVLDQEPLENILSFICSQNNNIKRISTMINWLCATYGDKIGTFNGQYMYTFPTLEALSKQQQELESKLRAAKFGYRAKFIAQSIEKICTNGGMQWFGKLRKVTFDEARLELVTLPGIGFKVADCICLMSLNHLEAVPIDTHIFKVAQREYMPELAATKTVTPKIYDDIAKHFRSVYGAYAGWAQTVLFCAELPQFQEKSDKPAKSKAAKKQRK